MPLANYGTTFVLASPWKNQFPGVSGAPSVQRKAAITHYNWPGIDAWIDGASVAVHLLTIAALERQLLRNRNELFVGPVIWRDCNRTLLKDIQIQIYGNRRYPQRPGIMLAMTGDRSEQLRKNVTLIGDGQSVIDGSNNILPIIPFEQHQAQMRAICDLVAAKTGLPLYDLST